MHALGGVVMTLVKPRMSRVAVSKAVEERGGTGVGRVGDEDVEGWAGVVVDG